MPPCLLPKISGVEVTPSVTSAESSEQFWRKIRQIWRICEPCVAIKWLLGWRIYLLLFPLIWNFVSIQSHSINTFAHSFTTYSSETQTSKLVLTPAQTVKKGQKSDKHLRLI